MTPDEAAAKAEGLFTVHDLRGLAADWVDQNDKVVGTGAHDMEYAPNGERYRTMTSYGIGAELPDDALVMFKSESMAASWWYDELCEWASGMAERDKWKKLNLYWRDKPRFVKTTYLIMDQGGVMREASPLAAIMQIELGFVWSRLLISAVGPDGKET